MRELKFMGSNYFRSLCKMSSFIVEKVSHLLQTYSVYTGAVGPTLQGAQIVYFVTVEIIQTIHRPVCLH